MQSLAGPTNAPCAPRAHGKISAARQALQLVAAHGARRAASGSAAALPGVLSSAELLEWMVRRGGVANGVELRVDRAADGSTVAARTLLATQAHEAGALLLSVPRQCQLRYDDEHVQRDVRLTRLFERLPRGSDTGLGAWQYKQALTLLWHQARGQGSPLHPHLQQLPGACPGVPVPDVGMLLADDVVPELQYAPLIQDVLNHKYWWAQFVEAELLPLRPDTSPFGALRVNKEAFGRSVAVVISRCFGLKRARAHSMPAVIDMSDHSLEPNCEVASSGPGEAGDEGGGGGDEGRVSMRSTRPLRAGEPLLLSYGPHSNADLVLSYGFCLGERNPHDRFQWPWDADVLAAIINSLCGADWVEQPLPEWKSRLLEQCLGLPSGGDAAAEEVLLGVGCQDPPVDGRLLGAVRVLVSKPDARALLESLAARELCDWDTPLARQHEVEVMRALSAFVTALYTSFPTSIQADRQLLAQLDGASAAGRANVGGADGAMRRQLRLAVSFRLSLKLALEQALKRVRARVQCERDGNGGGERRCGR